MSSVHESRKFLYRSIDGLNLPKEEKEIYIKRVNKTLSSFEKEQFIFRKKDFNSPFRTFNSPFRTNISLNEFIADLKKYLILNFADPKGEALDYIKNIIRKNEIAEPDSFLKEYIFK